MSKGWHRLGLVLAVLVAIYFFFYFGATLSSIGYVELLILAFAGATYYLVKLVGWVVSGFGQKDE